MRWHRRSVFPWIRHTGSSLLQLTANPHGGLTLADAPLIDAENLFRQPGPAQSRLFWERRRFGSYAGARDQRSTAIRLDWRFGLRCTESPYAPCGIMFEW